MPLSVTVAIDDVSGDDVRFVKEIVVILLIRCEHSDVLVGRVPGTEQLNFAVVMQNALLILAGCNPSEYDIYTS